VTPLTERSLPVGAAVGLAVFSALCVMAASALGGFVMTEGSVLATVGAAVLLLGGYALSIAAVWLVASRHGIPLAEAVVWRAPESWGPALARGLGVALLARVVVGLWVLLLFAFDIELPGADLDPTRLFGPGALGIALTVALVVVAAPLAEELVFRGVLLTSLDSAVGRTGAIALSSLAFALIHVTPFAIPPIFVAALLFGRLFTTSRSLPVAVFSHAVFNGIALLGLYLADGRVPL